MSAARKPAPISPAIPDWHCYESMKQDWLASHPNATHEEHQQAMRKIAEECGV